ncbi:hypothetical protein BH11MYX4_BH11MYX4_14210 [soil metagenome]
MRTGTLEIERWWQQLAPAERRSLRRPRERRSLQVVGRFVEPGEGDASDETTDFYEYLVNHELVLDTGRTFHICSAHPEARAVVSSGVVPATFRCPRAAEVCPMRRLLSERPSCDLLLSLAEVAR